MTGAAIRRSLSTAHGAPAPAPFAFAARPGRKRGGGAQGQYDLLEDGIGDDIDGKARATRASFFYMLFFSSILRLARLFSPLLRSPSIRESRYWH